MLECPELFSRGSSPIIPNTVYKFKSEEKSLLVQLGNNAEIVAIDAKSISIDELERLFRKGELDLSDEWKSVISNFKNHTPPNSIQYSCKIKTDANGIPNGVHIHASDNGKDLCNKTFFNKVKRMPNSNGKWSGKKGDSFFTINPDVIPKAQSPHGNPDNKTIIQLLQDIGETQPIKPEILFRNGYPIFNKDAATKNRRPLAIKINEGIGEYLKVDEIIQKKGKNINRENLHEEAFRRLANVMGVSIDEVKTFKGDLAAATRLAEQWKCTVQEVFEKCNNPNRVQRIWHECEDMQTMQLVPYAYHYITHAGGIERYCGKVLSLVE